MERGYWVGGGVCLRVVCWKGDCLGDVGGSDTGGGLCSGRREWIREGRCWMWGGGETNQILDKISVHFITAFQKSTFLSQNVCQN